MSLSKCVRYSPIAVGLVMYPLCWVDGVSFYRLSCNLVPSSNNTHHSSSGSILTTTYKFWNEKTQQQQQQQQYMGKDVSV